MLTKVASIFAILATLLGISSSSQAQIVQVMAGVDDSGMTRIIEAYEYDYATEKPQFPGGEDKFREFINETRQYPYEAYEKGIQGKVTCWFIINPDGSVSNINIKRSVNYLLDAEAIRIFSLMPAWEPGRDKNGKAVPVRVMRSVRFKK